MRVWGCRFSCEDDEDLGVFRRILEDSKEPYLLAGVLAIRNKNQRGDDDERKLERVSTKPDGFITENLFEFTIAKCKCFIHFQTFKLNEENNLCVVPTAIKCDYLEKFSYLGATFGRATVADGKLRIIEHRA